MTSWFEDDAFWERFAPFLFREERFQAAEEQTDGLLELVGVTEGDVLDLACGPGRFALPLARRGFRVTGVDRTARYLEEGQRRAEAEGLAVEWVREDMRTFCREEAFDLALSMFTSFGYMEDRAGDAVVLRQLHRSLRPGGVLVIDTMSSERLAKIFTPQNVDFLTDETFMVERRWVEDAWARVINEWILVDGQRVVRHRFHLNLYSGRELMDMARKAGFAEAAAYGTHTWAPYGPDAGRLVLVARKG